MLYHYLSRAIVLIALLMLTGCGGGGSGGDSGGDGGGGPTPPANNSTPQANAGADQNVAKNNAVFLDGSGSSDSDGNTLSYNWTLTATPSGSTTSLAGSTTSTPSFIADLAGNYEISLVVNDGFVDSAADTVSVIASNTVPIADAGGDRTTTKGLEILLDGSDSFDADNDPITYQWTIASSPNGSTADLSDQTTIAPSFTPILAGVYQFNLTVSDGLANSTVDSVTIEAINTAPIADAGEDRAIETGVAVSLNASNSIDENGDTLTYLWTINGKPDGSTASLSANDISLPAFTADLDGEFIFSLTVSDGELQSTADTVIFTATTAVANTTPVANAGDDQTISRSTLVQLDGSASSDADDDSLTYRWIVNTKPENSESELSDNNISNPTFVPDIVGDYLFSLVVNDGDIDSNIDSVTISAINNAPVSDAGPNQTLNLLSVATLDGSDSSDANGDTLIYSWTISALPNGSVSTLTNANTVAPTLLLDVDGTYLVNLMVNDGEFDSEISQVSIITNTVANNTAPVADAGDDQISNTGVQVTLDGSASTDADGDALTYRWEIFSKPDGSNITLSDFSAMKPVFNPDTDGHYTFTLVVNDGLASSNTDGVTVTAKNDMPIANAGSDQIINTGNLVTIDGSASSDPDGNSLTYLWTLDSPVGSTASLSSSVSVSSTFTPDLNGEYHVTLVVHDGTVSSTASTITITAFNEAPIADAGDNQTIHVGNLITFDGSASSDAEGNPLTYLWTLDDSPIGSSSALSNRDTVSPSFTPDQSGQYVVSLVVNDGRVSSDTSTITITATNTGPIANAGSNQSAHVHSVVTLDGSKSSDAENDPLTYSWTLDSQPTGGNVSLSDSTAVKPTFTPSIAGSYVFTLVVSEIQLSSDPDSVTIIVQNDVPIADAGSDITVLTNTVVTLDGSNSSDFESSSLIYRWTMDSEPQGSSVTLANSTLANPRFTPNTVGIYSLSLIVNDGVHNSLADTINVTVINSAPVANAGSDQIVSTGSIVTLDATGSDDANNDPLTYTWAIDTAPDTAFLVLSSTTSINPTISANVTGEYILSLTVNDGTVDSESDSVTITATNIAPEADAGPDQTVGGNQLVTLDGSGSSDPEGADLTYLWSLDTVPTDSAATLSDTTLVNPTFTVDRAGTYSASLIVTDGFDASTSDSMTITATDDGPVANAGQDIQINLDNNVSLDGSSSSDPNGLELTYLWAIDISPDGSVASLSTDNGVAPTLTPDVAGSYVLSLIVNNGEQNSYTDTVIITAAGWLINNINTSNYIINDSDGIGTLVDVQSINDNTISNVDFIEIQATGIPDYTVVMTQDIIATLNNRPKSATDFTSGTTSAVAGQSIEFGQSIGYDSERCTLGYWPTGPSCPSNQSKVENLPLIPKAATFTCATSGGTMGLMLNGTSVYNWLDGFTYNNEDVWQNIAAKFEVYDVDICGGHAQNTGDYHHHTFSTCLQDMLGDDGLAHSPIYGYAADGYPLYGPYHASGVLAKSAWVARDYDNASSDSGCGVAGQRTCLLVDQYDISKGTTTTTTGPTTSETVTSLSNNSFVTTSGYYFEDFYHDSALSDLGGEYLDKHNGHSHDNLGYHYHLTVINNNGTLDPVFPYNIGPTFYGQLPSGGIAACP